MSEAFLRVAGRVARAEVEVSEFADRVDHVWITLDVGRENELWKISINTLSKKNRDAGVDERIRVAVICSTWNKLPEPGIFKSPGFSYESLEKAGHLDFEPHGRQEMEELLLGLANGAAMVEAWGVPYFRKGKGLHQIHSRSPSSTVSKHLHNRDGALRFYEESEQLCRLVLLKFFGQE